MGATAASPLNQDAKSPVGAIGVMQVMPPTRDILIICRSAQRSYYATRILLQNGLKTNLLIR